MFGRRTMLGLAVTKRSITAVEVAQVDGGGQGRLAAELVLDESLAAAEPPVLGKALKQFLHEKGFSASRCVIGLEANTLTAREKVLPVGAGESVAAILSLMIEREFATDRQDLLFDYALGPDSDGQRSALLVATPRRTVDGLKAMAKAAGLGVVGITPSTIALAGCEQGAAAGDHLVLHLFDGGAELAYRRGGALRMMRRLPVSVTTARSAASSSADGWLGDLADELHRVVAMLGSADDAEALELVIWNETDTDDEAFADLSGRLGLVVCFCGRIEQQAGGGAAPAVRGGQFSAAAAMALRGLGAQPLAIDLCHSRLLPQRKRAIGRKVAWAAAAAAVGLALVTWALLDWRRDRIDVATLERQLHAMADDLDEAKATVTKVTAARPWYDRRPHHVGCMLDVVEAFPPEGSIWLTSLAVRDDMQVALSGKAVSESAVLDMMRDLAKRSAVSAVKLDYIRQPKRDSREVVFATSFTFLDSDGPWSSPNAKN